MDAIVNQGNMSWEFFKQKQAELGRHFRADPDCLVRWNEPATQHLTFRTGGLIGAMVFPVTVQSVIRTVELATTLAVPLLVLGKGSNTLIRDGGFPGVIIKLTDSFSGMTIEENEVTVKAGTTLSELAVKTARQGLAGLEWSSDIPGTVGGGIFMNAGMHHCTVSDCLKHVRALNCQTGQTLTIPRSECLFDYRQSRFQTSPDIILEAVFQLGQERPSTLLGKMQDIAAERKKKFPLEFPNAGSIFKRPPGRYAGELIEKAGLKGKRRGGAAISDKHANFIINTGQATAADIEALIMEVREIISCQFLVDLQPEIRIYGLPKK